MISQYLLIILPSPDLTITTDKLMEQFSPLNTKEIDKLGDKYRLGLPESEVGIIKTLYQSPTQRKEAYLDLYVHQHPCPSWVTIAETLHDFDLVQQVEIVVNTYVKGKNSDKLVVNARRMRTSVTVLTPCVCVCVCVCVCRFPAP